MIKQIELVQFPKMNHVRVLVNEIMYRNSHLHKEFEISLLLKGEGEITINNKKYACKPGDIFFVASNDVHSIASSRKNNPDDNSSKQDNSAPVFLILQVSNHFLLNYFPQIRTTVFDSLKLNDLLDKDAIENIRGHILRSADLYLHQEKNFQLELIANLAIIFGLLYMNVNHEIVSETEKQKNKRKSDRLQRIISYIELNYANHIRLEDIAGEENLSVTHFSHMFSSYFGVTFQEYINLKRLENSIRLMKDKQKSLLEISYESGFSDPKYMAKMFLKKFGCTPKQYRKDRLGEVAFSDDTNMAESLEGENIYDQSNAIQALVEFENSINKE